MRGHHCQVQTDVTNNGTTYFCNAGACLVPAALGIAEGIGPLPEQHRFTG